THCNLIAAVDVRPLIAVDFYRNEPLIDYLRGLSIIVRFPVHDVAPVTPDCPNVQQDRLILAASRGKCLLPPFVPLDRLMHGRAQVRGRGFGKRVEGLGGHSSSLIQNEELRSQSAELRMQKYDGFTSDLCIYSSRLAMEQ